MTVAMRVECLACHTVSDFSEYKLLEGALLVCPNCSAEFSLTATLETLPDGEGEEDFIDEPSPELPEPPEPSSSPPPDIPMELEPPVSASTTPAKREPVIEVHVLACSECDNSWVGTHARKCPRCKSEQVMRTTTTVVERALEAVEELERGVPMSRVMTRMTGRSPRRRRPAPRRRGVSSRAN